MGLIKQGVWVHQRKKILEKSKEDIAAILHWFLHTISCNKAKHKSGDAQAFPIHNRKNKGVISGPASPAMA